MDDRARATPQSAPPVMPRGTFIALVATLAAVLVFATTHAPLERATETPMEVSTSRALRAIDQPDGSVLIEDATSGESIATLAPGEESFIRSTLRSLARERRIRHVDDGAPFVLAQSADGSVWLEDRAVGTRLALAAYGWTQQEAFARLLGETRIARPSIATAPDSTRSIR
jgi:putative photosynthetic complex assembly protein